MSASRCGAGARRDNRAVPPRPRRSHLPARLLVHRVHRLRPMHGIATTIAALALLAGACGARAGLHPAAAAVSAAGPSGRPAASYELRADQTSDPRITVTVWSAGASRDGGRTFADLAIEIRNTGDGGVELDRDALALETFNSEGTPLPPARLAALPSGERSLAAPPRGASTIELRFELAVPVAPGHLGALRLRWGVVRADGERYVQFTEFRREPERAAAASRAHYDPVCGFYDPYFYATPYGHHLNYYVPVRRVLVADQPRR